MMTLSILQAEIPRRCNSCQKCLAAFSSGDPYWSVLQNAERQDFCISCWTEVSSTYDTIPCSLWKATIPLRKECILPAQTKLFSTLNLLKESLEKDPVETLLLALYLVRKRILTFRKDYKEGSQVFGLYEINSTEEIIAVKKVSLLNIDLKAIKQSIASKLAI